MVDSNNIEVMRENIKELDQKISEAGSGLPDPSAATDGQLLTVDDGEWTIADPPEGSVVVTLSEIETTLSEDKRTLIVNSFIAGKPVFIKKITSEYNSIMYQVTSCSYNEETYSPQVIEATRNVHYSSPARFGFVELRATTPGWAITETEYSELSKYTTTEQDTGKKWIDGKTIYQKTITGTTAASAGINNLVENIDSFVDVSGYVITDAAGTQLSTPFFVNGSNFIAFYKTDAGNLALVVSGTTLTSKDYVVTVQYTKPTPTTNTRSKKSTKKDEE